MWYCQSHGTMEINIFENVAPRGVKIHLNLRKYNVQTAKVNTNRCRGARWFHNA